MTERSPILGLSYTSDAAANRNINAIDAAVGAVQAASGKTPTRTVRTVTANATILATDDVIAAAPTAAGITLTLPPAATAIGRLITICRTDDGTAGDTSKLVLAAQGADLIYNGGPPTGAASVPTVYAGATYHALAVATNRWHVGSWNQ